MNVRIAAWWERLRSSLWFVPAVLAIAAVVLSFALVAVDHRTELQWVRTVGWVWAGGVEGARAVLSTIAGSVITVAGTTFSLTITALVLASSQFGPRLLRTFMSDRGNQFVLGTFIATFLYCLLVLRTVRSVEESRFVPYTAVTVGILLGLVSVGLLIYFIHHLADSIQADNLAAAVAGELSEAIDKLFPEKLGEPAEDEVTNPIDDEIVFDGGHTLRSACAGYVESIDDQKLMTLATEGDFIVRLDCRPGDFMGTNGRLAEIWPREKCDEETSEEFQSVFVVGRHRTPVQDADFSINQLVEIAVRALSPGINDPRTAMNCLDWLGDALGNLAARRLPEPRRLDEEGKLRVMLGRPVIFEEFCNTALNPIRHYGSGDPEVSGHLLRTIGHVARQARREEDKKVLRSHADQVMHDGLAAAVNPEDKKKIQESYRKILQELKMEPDR